MKNWRYRRYFRKPSKQPHPSRDDLQNLFLILDDLRTTGDSDLSAAYTYFGQLVDHDLTLMLDPSTPVNCRKPVLDLDTIYGCGLDDSGALYDRSNGKFILGRDSLGRERDLPRLSNGTPLIADRRNDENLLVAQMQVLFMNFHNKIVERLITRQSTDGSPQKLYDAARLEVTRTYQYLVLHDFGRRILPDRIYQKLIKEEAPECLLTRTDEMDPDDPALPLEFSGAAFRMHSLVRRSYKLNPETSTASVSLREIFRFTGGGRAQTNSVFPLPAAKVVDWLFFFDNNVAKPLTMKVLPFGEHVMPELTILRGLELDLSSGQNVHAELVSKKCAAYFGLQPLNVENSTLRRLTRSNSVRSSTPLWLYLMLESVQKSYPDPLKFDDPELEISLNAEGRDTRHKFGAVGGWLVADSLLIAARLAGYSSVWRPDTSAIYQDLYGDTWAGEEPAFTLKDLIRFTYPEMTAVQKDVQLLMTTT